MTLDTATTQDVEQVLALLAAAEEVDVNPTTPLLPGDFVDGDDDLSLGMWSINGSC